MMRKLGLFAVFTLFCSAVAAQVTPPIQLSAGPNMPPVAGMSPGTQDHPATQFILAASGAATFQALTIQNKGTAGATDFDLLSLYKDNNFDGLVDNGDTLITTFASGSFPVSSTFSNPVQLGLTATGDVFLVAINVSSGATPGATFAFMTQPADVTCSTSVTAAADVQGELQTVISSGPLPVNITTTSLNDGAESVAYNETIQATGGTAPFTWSGSGIPGFLSLDTASTTRTTTLTGTPGVGDTGNYSFSVTITDATAQFDTQNYTIDIIAAGAGVSIITTSLPSGTELVSYNQSIDTGGGASPYTWVLDSGALPPGLSLDTGSTASSTTLSGTPTTAGAYNFTVRVDDASGFGTQAYTVVISVAGSGSSSRRSSSSGCAAGTSHGSWWLLLPLFAVFALALRRRSASV